MTEGSLPGPKSTMKVVMNSKAIMITVYNTYLAMWDFYSLKTSENLSLTISESKNGRKSSKDAKLRSGE